MHSLGRLMLLFASNSHDYSHLIDYQQLSFKTQTQARLLKEMRSHYSGELCAALAKMLEEQPTRRMTFEALDQYFKGETYSHLRYLTPKKKQSKRQASTCSSGSHVTQPERTPTQF
jgi:hypothetical protein